ncbi:MAG: MBL fold metallo-hydrolase [Clostridia bacterium]
MMELTYLGTAAAEGWPALFCRCESCQRAAQLGGKDIRTRAQAVVDDQLLLDFGPDTYLHSLYRGLKLAQVHTVLVTHAHQDHFEPLELILRGEPYAHDSDPAPMTVYGCGEVKRLYERAMEQNDSPNLTKRVIFSEVSEFVPFQTVEGYWVTPLLAKHDPAQKCLIYLVEKDGKSLLYAHDSGAFPSETWDCLQHKHLDIVSLDCTMGMHADGQYHMGLPDAKKVRERMLAMGCATEYTQFAANHFSHNGGLTHAQLCAAAQKMGMLAAYDGLRLQA